jgi:beta-mannosidase
VDGKKFLKSGINEITVQLHSPSFRGEQEMQKLPYRLPMGSDAGEVKVSAFTRKAPYHYGWDWSPRFLTMGIWQPVFISAHDNVYISDIQLKTIEIADTCAWLSGFVTIYSHVELPNAVITIKDGFKQFRLKRGTTTTQVKFKIDNPELWWPNGFGKQPLYDITAKLYVNNYLVDSITGCTGIRTVELFQDEDEWGSSFYFRVNGLPIFMKGTNYIPQSNFLTEITDSAYTKIIGDVKSVGMNMLRVWGGGIYEKDIFYDLCDENGILVWQDFMFAGSMYPGDSSFMKNVKAEVTQQIKRLRNHPCIALWCGNNEIEVAWNNWGWQKEFGYSLADSMEIHGNYKLLFEDKIPSLLAQYDDTRPYIPSSPISNWGNKKNFKTGNMHYWGVWHGEESIDSFRANVPRFMTEYGMQSFPSFESLKRNSAEERITLGSEFIKNRQRSYKGNRLLLDYIDLKFGPAKNVEDLCYLSQLNQAEAMRIAIESHRKEARYCMGSLYWQLNDVWDGASWSTIEHNGKWKAAHYRLKSLYAQNILIAETINDTTTVYLQSDNTDGVSGKLRIDILDLKGRSLGSYWLEAATGYLVATQVFQMPVNAILKKNDKADFFLKMQLLRGDSVMAQTLHYFVTPKELNFPVPDIQTTVTPTPGGALIKLHSYVLAKGVMLEFENTPGHFSDNYFDLLPGEEKVVVFKGVLKTEEASKLLRIKFFEKN